MNVVGVRPGSSWSWRGAGIATRSLRVLVAQNQLSAEELALVREAPRPKRKQEIRVGRIAAHAALRNAGLEERTEVLRSNDGSPVLRSAGGWRVSICHGGEWAGAAASLGGVGIDIEPVSRLGQVGRVVDGWSEASATSVGLPLPWPLLQWTAWEALAKVSGAGVLAERKWVVRPRLTGDGLVAQSAGCSLRWWGVDEHVLCVAVEV
jgi:hypothetical protein